MMRHSMKGIKGFAIRRPGRSLGSRAADRNQSDMFSVEKFLAQCGWANNRHASERASGAPPQAVPPATNRGGKVQVETMEEFKDFCDY